MLEVKAAEGEGKGVHVDEKGSGRDRVNGW